MFENIGSKIKSLAIVVCVIGMIASAVFGMKYITDNGYGDSLVLGLVIIAIGCIISWISVFILYGFGELIEKVCTIESMMRMNNTDGNKFNCIPNNDTQNTMKINNLNETNNSVHVQTWQCSKCGYNNMLYMSACQKCGNVKP